MDFKLQSTLTKYCFKVIKTKLCFSYESKKDRSVLRKFQSGLLLVLLSLIYKSHEISLPFSLFDVNIIAIKIYCSVFSPMESLSVGSRYRIENYITTAIVYRMNAMSFV